MSRRKQWDTVEQAVASLKERRDDIDSIVLVASKGPFKVAGDILTGPFAQVRFCSESAVLIAPDIVSGLVNDGVLYKLRIPFRIELPE